MKELVLSAREPQVDLLRGLLGRSGDWPLPSLFIYGHPSCGKTSILTHVLKDAQRRHVVVNCIECYSTPLLYDVILRELGERDTKCENMNDFVKKLRKMGTEEATFIVLDKAEALRDREDHLLPAMINLQELTSLSLGVVLVSSLPWEKFGIGLRSPYIIHFQDYTRGQLAKILSHLHPPGADEGFYSDYISVILHVFASACNDLRELRHVAEVNFPIYCTPIHEGVATAEDRRKLWKHVEPHLQRARQQLYLREVQSKDRDKGSGVSPNPPSAVELPFYSKFLLIASYLASFNPASSDRRFFLKNAGRMKRSARSVRRDERKNLHLRGPRAFPIDRLMAIFYSIVDGRVPPSASLFAQVTSLASLHLLGKVSHEDEIDAPRYKCLAPLELVTGVARTVGFDLVRYLYDFI